MFTDLGMTTLEKEAFTKGDCWRLAKALNHLTGWTMVAFMCPNQSYRWNHMGIITPQGDYLDVEGVQSPEHALDAWKSYFSHCCDPAGQSDCAALIPMTHEEWEDIVDDQDPKYGDVADPLMSAQELLAAYIEFLLTKKQ